MHSSMVVEAIESLSHNQMCESLQSDGVNIWCFKLELFDLTEFNLKSLSSKTLGCKDIGIIKSDFVTKLCSLALYFLWISFLCKLISFFFFSLEKIPTRTF